MHIYLLVNEGHFRRNFEITQYATSALHGVNANAMGLVNKIAIL